MIDFLYLSFGKTDSLKQALFSVLSLLSYQPTTNFRINIATDNPNFFNEFIGEWDITYLFLDDEIIAKMRGDIDFLHRMKIAAIEMLFKRGAQKIFYVDSDTFFVKPIHKKMLSISPRQSLVHKHEFYFSKAWKEDATSPTKVLYQLLQNGKVCINQEGKPLKMDVNFSSWNAGVIGIDCVNFHLLKSVYEFTDVIFSSTGHHASEQFSFSFVLERNCKIVTCEKEVFHYWPALQKELSNKYLNDFFSKNFPATPKEKLSLTQIAIAELYHLLTTHPRVMTEGAIKEFYQKRYFEAYLKCGKAIIYGNYNYKFLKDIAYHTKKIIFNR